MYQKLTYFGNIYNMKVWKKTAFNQGQLLLYSSTIHVYVSMSLIFNLTRVCKKKKKIINKLRGFTKFFKWWDFGHACIGENETKQKFYTTIHFHFDHAWFLFNKHTQYTCNTMYM